MIKRNIYLAGFMGTGKSTVGRELARLLGRQFLDLDTVIENRLGLTISEIFATQGEAWFREREKEIALELSQLSNKVIATGGGTLLDPQTTEALRKSGLVICLFTREEELVDRLGRSRKRPLLPECPTEEQKVLVDQLLKKRAEIYDRISIRLDTTDLTPQEAARKIIALIRTRQMILDKLQSQYIVIS